MSTIRSVFQQQIEIPQGCTVKVEDRTVTVSGPKGTLSRTFPERFLTIAVQNGELTASTDLRRKRARAMVGTVIAHVRNMFRGVLHGYTYELKVVYSHFPMSIEHKGNEIIIKNFIGERGVRKARVYDDIKLQIREDEIIITGIDLEHVSQSAANIQQSLRLRGKDRRVFMDGVYVIRKRCGDQVTSVV
ncbi:MAG: 50S ribosomal protein L6 [Candidatus Thorarchaeota archaeon]